MNFRNPELQRLLDSLNNASQSRTQTDTHNVSTANGHDAGSTVVPPSQSFAKPGAEPHIPPSQQTLVNLKPAEFRSRSTTPSIQLAPDASTITTWPAAIKYVTKHIISDEKATTRIKHLIKQQQQHEEQWWSQREAIVAKHSGRAGSNSKVADILKGLGGLAAPIAKVDEAADKNELETFDRKVYKSLVQMAADFDGQLRKLGVPFYAIKHDLVLVGSEDVKDVATRGKLDKGELRDLQRRMLQHLEDLLMDD